MPGLDQSAAATCQPKMAAEFARLTSAFKPAVALLKTAICCCVWGEFKLSALAKWLINTIFSTFLCALKRI